MEYAPVVSDMLTEDIDGTTEDGTLAVKVTVLDPMLVLPEYVVQVMVQVPLVADGI